MNTIYENKNLRIKIHRGSAIVENVSTGHKMQIEPDAKTLIIKPDVQYLGAHPEMFHWKVLN